MIWRLHKQAKHQEKITQKHQREPRKAAGAITVMQKRCTFTTYSKNRSQNR